MAEYDDILDKKTSFLFVKSDKDELLEQINVATIVRFVLFGKVGKITSADASIPLSPEIKVLIEKHM